MIKERKGITLIALVITIIVLLILAGVSISMLIGDNGILTRGKWFKNRNNNRSIERANKVISIRKENSRRKSHTWDIISRRKSN